MQEMADCEEKQEMLEDLNKQIDVFVSLFDPKHHEHLLGKGGCCHTVILYNHYIFLYLIDGKLVTSV